MPYTAVVPVDFTGEGSYSPPLFNAVDFSGAPTQYVLPVGPAGVVGVPALSCTVFATGLAPSSGFGLSSVGRFRRALFPAGWASAAYGTASLRDRRTLAPSSWAAGGIGSPVFTAVRFVRPPGWSSAGIGLPAVAVGRVLLPPAVAPSSVFGLAAVAPGVRLLVPTGLAPNTAGLATIILPVRFLAPTGLAPTSVFGVSSLSHGVRLLAPTGLATTLAFGPQSAVLLMGDAAVAPTGVVPTGAFGAPSLTHGVRFLAPAGLAPTGAFGLQGTVFLRGVDVVAPTGWPPTGAFGHSSITLLVRLLAPPGLAPTGAFGPQSSVLLTGDAGVAAPSLVASGAFGAPSLTHGVRLLAPAGLAPTNVFGPQSSVLLMGVAGVAAPSLALSFAAGLAWITHRSRPLAAVGIVPIGAFGSPALTHGTRTLVLAGLDAGGFGAPALTRGVGNRTLLVPGWLDFGTGAPALANQAQGARGAPWTSSVFGDATVSNAAQDIGSVTLGSLTAWGQTGLVLIPPIFTWSPSASSRFGTPAVIAYRRFIYPPRIYSESWTPPGTGDFEVFDPRQVISAPQPITGTFGTASITHWIQFQYPFGFRSGALGVPAHAVLRHLLPLGVPSRGNLLGAARVARGREILPEGLAPGVFDSNMEIGPWTRSVLPSGFRHGAAGEPSSVWSTFYEIHPAGIVDVWQNGTVVGTRRMVRPIPEDAHLPSSRFGDRISLDLRLRDVRPFGHPSSKVLDGRQRPSQSPRLGWDGVAPGVEGRVLHLPFEWNWVPRQITREGSFVDVLFEHLGELVLLRFDAAGNYLEDLTAPAEGPVITDGMLIADTTFTHHAAVPGIAPAYNREPLLGRGYMAFDSRYREPYRAMVGLTVWVLRPDGLAAPAVPTPAISHRHRTLRPPGIESFACLPWTIVYNSARDLRPSAIPSAAAVGRPDARNRNVYVGLNHRGIAPGLSPSAALVAYRIRTLYAKPTVFEPWTLPQVRFNPHPFKPLGVDSYRTGGHYVVEQFTIFRPAAILPSTRFGVHFLAKAIREIHPSGARPDAGVFGRLFISNYIRTVAAIPWVVSIGWGRSWIGSPHRTVFLTEPSQGSVVSDALQVSYTSVTPFIPRMMWVPKYRTLKEVADELAGAAAAQRNDTFGSHAVRTNSVYPPGWMSEKFGVVKARGNVIFPPCVQLDQASARFGAVLINGIQFIQLGATAEIPKGAETPYVPPQPGNGIDSAVYGKPRVSPHTIWCWEDPPDQATQNHPGQPFKKVDEQFKETQDGGDGKWWYDAPRHRADVQHQHRTVRAASTYRPANVGDPTLDLGLRFLYPGGWRGARVGYPHFPFNGGPIEAIGWRSTVIITPDDENPGGLVVTQGPPPRLMPAPGGWQSCVFGATRVNHFHRSLPVASFNTLPKFGGLRIHFPEPRFLQGWVDTRWGATRIAHRIRTVLPVGTDFQDLEYEFPGKPTDLMRVRHANVIDNPGLYPPRTYPVQGLDSLVFGPTTVYNLSQHVHVDGFSSRSVTVPAA